MLISSLLLQLFRYCLFANSDILNAKHKTILLLQLSGEPNLNVICTDINHIVLTFPLNHKFRHFYVPSSQVYYTSWRSSLSRRRTWAISCRNLSYFPTSSPTTFAMFAVYQLADNSILSVFLPTPSLPSKVCLVSKHCQLRTQKSPAVHICSLVQAFWTLLYIATGRNSYLYNISLKFPDALFTINSIMQRWN